MDRGDNRAEAPTEEQLRRARIWQEMLDRAPLTDLRPDINRRQTRKDEHSFDNFNLRRPPGLR